VSCQKIITPFFCLSVARRRSSRWLSHTQAALRTRARGTDGKSRGEGGRKGRGERCDFSDTSPSRGQEWFSVGRLGPAPCGGCSGAVCERGPKGQQNANSSRAAPAQKTPTAGHRCRPGSWSCCRWHGVREGRTRARFPRPFLASIREGLCAGKS